MSHKGGQDILAQAMSGVMARKPRSTPCRLTIYATALADYSAGMHLVQGILLALLQREQTGHGQQVSVSLYDSMLAMQMQEAAMWLLRKRDLNWGALPLTGVFETTDGAVVIVGAFKDNPLQDICRALGLPDLSADPELRHLRQAGREQGRIAPPVPRQALDQHHRALARPARGAGSAVRTGPDAAARRWPRSRPRSTAWWSTLDANGRLAGATSR